jgi:hypothetical protein
MSGLRDWALPARRRRDGGVDLRLASPWRATIKYRAEAHMAALEQSAPKSLLEPGEQAGLEEILADIAAADAVHAARLADLAVVVATSGARHLDAPTAAAWLRALNGLRLARGGDVVRGLPSQVAAGEDPRRPDDPDWAVIDVLVAALLHALSG